MTKPLPCPFCGGDDWTARAFQCGDSYYVRCNDCEAEGPPADSRNGAIIAWNARVTPIAGKKGKG